MSEPRFGCRNPNGNKMRRNTETQLRKSLRRNLRNKTQGRRIPRNRTKKDIRKERSEDPICLVSRASLHSSDCLSRHETTQGAIEGRQRRGENTIHTEKVAKVSSFFLFSHMFERLAHPRCPATRYRCTLWSVTLHASLAWFVAFGSLAHSGSKGFIKTFLDDSSGQHRRKRKLRL